MLAWIFAEWDSKGGCENAVIPNEAEAFQSEPAVRIPRLPFAAPGTTERAAFGAADIFFTQRPRIMGKDTTENSIPV